MNQAFAFSFTRGQRNAHQDVHQCG
jgi:hypothetical protein